MEIADCAPRLRAGGVVGCVKIDDIEFELAPHTPVTVHDFKAEEPQASSDPLYDSSTYAGGNVPGFDFSEFDKPGESS